jgi:hypothetical protein
MLDAGKARGSGSRAEVPRASPVQASSGRATMRAVALGRAVLVAELISDFFALRLQRQGAVRDAAVPGVVIKRVDLAQYGAALFL